MFQQICSMQNQRKAEVMWQRRKHAFRPSGRRAVGAKGALVEQQEGIAMMELAH
jgi:hypothetical protein